MGITANMGGTRLSFVVVALPGTVKRPVCRFVKGEGIVTTMEEEKAGYLVYFPKGHVIRIRTDAELAHYKLDGKAKLINLQGLNDPNSAIGKIIHAQDQSEREDGFEGLKQAVIALATAKTGGVLMPEQLRSRRAEAV